MARVLDADGNVQGEPISSNNFDSVTCENLKARTGQDAIVTSTLTKAERGTTVSGSIQNTRLSETVSGNVIVTLLDEAGNVLGVQQSYTGSTSGSGLIELSGEERKTLSFAFIGTEYQDAVSTQVVYSDLILGADNANLASLSFSSFPGITLASFTEDENEPGVYRASVSVMEVTSTAVMAVAESSLAVITLSGSGETGNAVSTTVSLMPGTVQEIVITVTNGTAVKTYILTVENSEENCPSLGFRDLDPTRWYHMDVDFVLKNSLGNGIFAPESKLSRAMLVTMLWRLDGKPAAEGGVDFTDVPDGQYYSDAVRWASANGIVLGYGNSRFGPGDDITREQLAAILYRYEQYRGGGFTDDWMVRMDYVDLERVSGWAYEALCWMTKNGIINGPPGKVLDPQGSATRAEAAAMLRRYCEVMTK